MSESTTSTETNTTKQPPVAIGALAAGSMLSTEPSSQIKSEEQAFLEEFTERDAGWITDGLDDGSLKQINMSTSSDRFYHFDLTDNPIESGSPLGDLVIIVQTAKRDIYVWRLEGEDDKTQFMLSDKSFSLNDEGSHDGWWVPLEKDQTTSVSDTVGDDKEGELDIILSGHNNEFELALRNRGNSFSRLVRAETTAEVAEEARNKSIAKERKAQAEERVKRLELLNSQKFDNFVDYTDYGTFLDSAVQHYMRAPDFSGSKDAGVKYTEIHTNADGDTYILPAPRAMRPYGATVSGHHSIVDELRAWEGYEEFPNYMKFVNKLRVDTNTVRSKGYIKLEDNGQLVLELDQNRGKPDERADFTWLRDATESAKAAGIDRVVLDEHRSDEILEIDLDAETDISVSYSPEYVPFHGSEFSSPSLTVGVLEEILVEDTKTVKVGYKSSAAIKNVQKIKVQGSEADIQLHGPLYDKLEQSRKGFKDTEYPVAVDLEGGRINLAVSYQYDRSLGEIGVSFRYETEPTEEFFAIQDIIINKLVDSVALQSRNAKKITGSASYSIGSSGLPNNRQIDVINPYARG